MELYPWTDESGIVIFSTSKDLPEIVEIWVNRGGILYAKITCPKDRVASITVGNVDLPADIRKTGKKNFRSVSTKWLLDEMKGIRPILRYGSKNSFHLSFKLEGRIIEFGGKFRM
jgi:hypothetical protein